MEDLLREAAERENIKQIFNFTNMHNYGTVTVMILFVFLAFSAYCACMNMQRLTLEGINCVAIPVASQNAFSCFRS